VRARVTFEPRDLWVGIYWDRDQSPANNRYELHLFICLIPTLPIHVWWSR
jgi:hypothetical protein